ncbi:F-box/FBD/LRR-repeat protein At5g56420 [Eutrema salsugineum]|uniref:F-box/FBD/LRR-repeat protein At5g56420 n=1 Tax=Eutrema salsugineum TaxID=72664 RepID=UPI000CED6B7A|nr:F-box/FBD/LRR-repeat protein At5g56420 [Eutrema salsugineum]
MDKVSQLPDDLLIKILSLVPTKNVIAMSILSKRWRSLWTLLPRLIFGEDDEDEEEHAEYNWADQINLSQVVYTTLLLHKAQVLECFHLNITTICSASEIELWVRVAVDRFVRDLKIRFCNGYGLITLPISLYRSETLETLELRSVKFLEVPSQFSFPSLKRLRLLFVKYADEESFVRLISNCPVLEDLVVETCHNDNVATFTVNVPSLESLSIRHTLPYFGTEGDVFVVHYHSLKQLTINLDYIGDIKFIGNNMPKLVEANLVSLSCHAKVLASFPNIKRLFLCLDGEALYPIGTVLFQLVRLELCLCESNWTNMLVSVLQHSPKLQVLKLALNHFLSEDRNVCWIQPSCVPECLLLHLNTFEWRDYGGSEEEKQVAVYILKNARRLVTATIYPDSAELASKHEMFEELEIESRFSTLISVSQITLESSKHLVVFKLQCKIRLDFAGSPVWFRSLKSLHLTGVMFSFCRFLSACPVLEDLFFVICFQELRMVYFLRNI